MRKVFLNMTMTLDGFFCGPNGELDWMSQTPDQELNDDIVAFFQGVDQGFIGYPTASGMIPYWLNVAQNPSASKEERAIAQAVNTFHPFILSNREEKLAWENTELLVVKSDDNLVEAVKKMKQQPGKDIYLIGGGRITTSLIDAGLVDELRLIVYPLIAGEGKALFATTERRRGLELRKVQQLPDGCVSLIYGIG